ncbi:MULTISPECIES: thiol reductant ABC exporter subunit CydC [Microbacterium]|uniref:thiol reductant ABC exporter subunit CydC n=1 Tax=Microbacterium TaxID=33882 RepID=UPI00278A5143|nr:MULTISPECIES: thiol reductant ABC exporter subunit CydC [Microbacterium]MDQ1076019.1 ATP-binding cassette subfamily C protein CydC [Microbacterium sp. SORGH_AS_0969]MDQ1116259.1 ATP-binding cassette subfamily C protein CydC [Microbacterium testaceum]
MNTRVRGILRSAMPSRRRFAPAVLSGFGTALSAVALLAASAWLIARAAEQPLVMYLSAAVVGVRAFALSRGVFRYLERLTSHDAALHQLAGLRADLVRELVPLAPDGLGRAHRGGLLSSVVDDVEELQNLPLRVVLPLSAAALTSLAAVVFTAFISWPAALVLLACLVVAFGVAVAVGWAAGSRAERSVAPLRTAVADAVHDLLTNLDVLTAYGALDAARERVRSADAALRRALVRRGVAQGLTSGTVSVLAGAASLLALAVAAPGVTGGTLSGPGLAVVVLLPMAVFEVFGPVPLALASWRQVRAAAERIAEAVPETIPDGLPQTEPAATGTGPALGEGLVLRGLAAHWPARSDSDGDAGRLDDVELRVCPGERVLVSGPSGAGKTTLAHVLVRFLDYAGSYTVGGIEARELSGDDLRRTVGLIEQAPFLFDESVRQNLLFARDTASDADLWAVLARVGLDGWVRERGGLDTRVGDRGVLVSGGQAQRLALARALLRGFPVLVLDEPTAGVDPAASEALLHDLLGAVDRDRAVLLVSHVEVPAGLVDREVRMEDGRVVSG